MYVNNLPMVTIGFPLVDVINPEKCCDYLFKGFNLTRVKVSIFFHGKVTSPF